MHATNTFTSFDPQGFETPASARMTPASSRAESVRKTPVMEQYPLGLEDFGLFSFAFISFLFAFISLFFCIAQLANEDSGLFFHFPFLAPHC
jgi:hypothetical protein